MADLPVAAPGIFSPRVLLRLLAIFLPAALLTGGVVVALYEQDLTNEHALHEQAGQHRVSLHGDIIQRELKSVESDLLYLANQAALRAFLDGHAAGRQELEDEYMLFCRRRGTYDQIRYLDAAGRERIRINYNDGWPAIVPKPALQAKARRYYFFQTMRLNRGEVFVSPFDLNIEHDQIEKPLKPMIRFGTPVYDRQGVKRGILILNYLGGGLIAQLAEVSASFPGSVWLLNREGFFLRGPTPKDEWGFMLGHARAFATNFPEEWPHLTVAGRGQIHTDRGLFTFRTLAPGGGLPGRPLAKVTAAGRREEIPGDPTLMVVAHISPAVLDGQAGQVLGRLLLLYGVVLLLVFVLAWYLAYAGAVRRDHERNLASSAARLRTLSTQLLTAQEDERRSLARDLHDELGQVVTSITLDLQRAAQLDDRGGAGDRERKDQLIGRALNGAACLLDQIHEIAARLRPTLLDDLGLKDAVQSYLSEFENRTGIATRGELRFERAQIPPAIGENVYRILQEALTNVSRHARAVEVVVALQVNDEAVTLTVRDPGVGMTPAPLDGRRLGILGMRERAELLDGTFVLKSEPGKGTEVQVTIPISKG